MSEPLKCHPICTGLGVVLLRCPRWGHNPDIRWLSAGPLSGKAPTLQRTLIWDSLLRSLYILIFFKVSGYKPLKISKVQGQSGSTLHRKLLRMWRQWPLHFLRWLLWTHVLVPDLKSSTKNFQPCTLKTTERDLGRGLWHPLNMQCWEDRLLCAEPGQWVTDWDITCALEIELL